MFDQSFSVAELTEIFDKENRKGNNVENAFQKDFSKSIEKLKEIQSISKEVRRAKSNDDKVTLLGQKRELRKERDGIIKEILENVSSNIHIKAIELEVISGPVVGKQTFQLEKTLVNFFISKKIQNNLSRTYKVKQSNRSTILTQLINHLKDDVPKVVLRMDIKSFYESIPQDFLKTKLNQKHLLSVLTKRIINKTLEAYNKQNGHSHSSSQKPIGIPRGIGFSSHLAEIFMREIDSKIRMLDDLSFYSRYVDDMIFVFVPKSMSGKSKAKVYEDKVKAIIEDHGLSLNPKKTKSFDLVGGLRAITKKVERYEDNKLVKSTINPEKCIEFLGYEISYSIFEIKYSTRKQPKKRCEISINISGSRLDKYKKRIEESLKAFENKRHHNESRAFKLLYSRLVYLCGNTRLRNNKSNVLVGIYFSNPFVENSNSFEVLDSYLKDNIAKHIFNSIQQDLLNNLSFSAGFTVKNFISYPIQKKKYKNHNSRNKDTQNQSNKGVLQYGLTEINSIWKHIK